jgi:hypothetical protein|nr:MAG TPA: hypothetical protein [Caudoviricetes sp.]
MKETVHSISATLDFSFKVKGNPDNETIEKLVEEELRMLSSNKIDDLVIDNIIIID